MAADGRKHILAIGGGALMPRETFPLYCAEAIRLSGKARPKMRVLNTAEGDNPATTQRIQDRLAGGPGELRHLALFPMPNVADPEDLLLSQDVVFVGGGSVANMLAVWRVHGLDEVFRKAWEAGVVLLGSSAGGICWFEGGTTDSFGPELRPFTDGLGLLKGSYCPHYESEELRRPLFQRLVQDGTLPDGYGCDDGVAVHYVDDELAEVVADRPGARGFSVRRGSEGMVEESALDVRFLGE